MSLIWVIYAVLYKVKALAFVKAANGRGLLGVAGAFVCVFNAGNRVRHGLDLGVMGVIDGGCVRLAVYTRLEVFSADVRTFRLRLRLRRGRWRKTGAG